jgi:hypothetical protein
VVPVGVPLSRIDDANDTQVDESERHPRPTIDGVVV